MAVDERARHELYVWLEQHAGRERADTMMALLPPVGWADVATKVDLDHLRVAMKSDVDRLRAEFKSDLDQLRVEVRSDVDRLRAEFKSDLDQLRVEVKSDVDQLRGEVRSDLHQLRGDVDHLRVEVKSDLESLEHRLLATFRGEMLQQTRTFLFAVVTVMITLVPLTYAAVRLG